MAKDIISKIKRLRRPENTFRVDSVLEHLNLIFDSFNKVYERNKEELSKAKMFIDWSVEHNKPVSEHPDWPNENEHE